VKPSILFVSNFLSKRGVKRGISEEVADRLEQRGWPVIRTSSVLSRPLRMIDMISAVCQHRRHFAVALVDVFSGPAFLWAETVCLILRCIHRPYILTLHGGALPEFAERWPSRVQTIMRSASVVAAPSAFLARHMARYRRDILVVPNGIEWGDYPPPEHSSTPKLVWLRSFHRIYNPQMAVEVLALLRREFPNIELLMIGPDDGDGSLEETRKRATELGVSGSVCFTGVVPKAEVPSWLAQGTVFLNTTDIDNAPVSLLEAMACGLPVVSTNVGGISDLVEHGRNALLVPPRDPRAMAARISDVLRNSDLANELSKNGRQSANVHSWARILPRWEEVLCAVIKGSSAAVRATDASFEPLAEGADGS
jgi:glycosyltransferase involved in cell wall biosynthesis